MSKENKTPIYLRKAIARYNEKNKEKVRYNQYKSRAKTFIMKLADNLEDLELLQELIDKKTKELKPK